MTINSIFRRHTLYICCLLLLVGLAGCYGSRNAQTFNFYSDGRYKVFAPRKVQLKNVIVNIDNDKTPKDRYQFYFTYDKKTGTFKLTQAPTGLVSLEDADIEKINKQLAARITLALDDLADSTTLQNLYKRFWGEPDFTKLTAELRSLAQDLKKGTLDKTDCSNQYPDFNNLCDLETALGAAHPPYDVSVRLNPENNKYHIFISKKNWFNECLRDFWTTALKGSDMDDRSLDHDYRTGWKTLETTANRLIDFNNRLNTIDTLSCDTAYDVDSLKGAYALFQKDTLDKLDQNTVLKMINDNKSLYRSTFWYNYGFFGINPLGYTTPARRYKVLLYQASLANLHDKIAMDKLRNAATCCALSMNGVDSLIRQLDNGKKIFSTDTTVIDPIWGFNDLNSLRNSIRLMEKLELPVTIKNCHPQRLLQFDASSRYWPSPDNTRNKTIASTDSISYVVYNVPNGVVVSIPQTVQPTSNTSALEDAFASISGISGLNTAIAAVPLTPLNAPSSFPSFAAPPAPAPLPTVRFQLYTGRSPVATSPNKIVLRYIDLITGLHDTLDVVKGISERELLLRYLHKFSPASFNIDLVNFFFTHCHPTSIIDFSDPVEVAAALQDMVTLYFHILALNKSKQDSLAPLKKQLDSGSWIIQLASITDRSLPPLQDDLTATCDSIPAFRSQVNAIPVVDSTRAIQAAIIEKKPAKKDTVTTTYNISPALRIGKKQSFMISAGIIANTSIYHQKTASIVNNQLSVVDNASTVSYEVGLHWYPAGLFQIDNSFLGIGRGRFWNRFSLFAGLGLPNPLKDYYPGIGLDLVPGFKLIAGGHLFLNTRYQVINDQIATQINGVKFASVYVGFNIDPTALVSVLGLFK